MKKHSKEFIYFGELGSNEDQATLYINKCGELKYIGYIGEWIDKVSRKEIKEYFRKLELFKRFDCDFPF